MAGHRYWRVLLSNSASFLECLELTAIADPNGSDLLTSSNISASTEFSASFDAENAVDGDIVNSRWSTESGDTSAAWLKASFSTPQDVLQWTYRSHVNETYAPDTIDIQYSDDDSNWTTVQSNSGLTWTTREVKTFTLIKAQGLALISSDNDKEYQMLVSLGYSGTINDMQAAYLRDLGYSGSLNDMLKEHRG